MGIFGFLSKAHLQNEFADGSVTQKIELINSQIQTEEGIIARQNEIIKRASGTGTTNTIRIEQLNQRLLQLDAEVEAYTKQGSSFLGGDSVRKGSGSKGLTEGRTRQHHGRDQSIDQHIQHQHSIRRASDRPITAEDRGTDTAERSLWCQSD
jgi:hypothetical protein